jgi:hypothetical protein
METGRPVESFAALRLCLKCNVYYLLATVAVAQDHYNSRSGSLNPNCYAYQATQLTRGAMAKLRLSVLILRLCASCCWTGTQGFQQKPELSTSR